MSSSEGCPVIEVAPRGDLFIVAGEGSRIIQVNRNVLRDASPLFDTMLSDQFKEGNENFNADSPLDLPDDDENAFLNVCFILHNKWDQIDTDVQLQTVACLCDKYCCLKALDPYFGYQLPNRQDVSPYDQMMVAFAMGEEKMFWNASARVIELATSDIAPGTLPVPFGVIKASKKYRKQTRVETIVAAIDPTYKMLERKVSEKCCTRAALLSRHYDLLFKHGLPLGKTSTEDLPLIDGRKTLLTISAELQHEMPPAMNCTLKTKRCCDEFEEDLRSAAAKIEKGVSGNYGFCLHCVKEGNYEVVKSCDKHAIVPH